MGGAKWADPSFAPLSRSIIQMPHSRTLGSLSNKSQLCTWLLISLIQLNEFNYGPTIRPMITCPKAKLYSSSRPTERRRCGKFKLNSFPPSRLREQLVLPMRLWDSIQVMEERFVILMSWWAPFFFKNKISMKSFAFCSVFHTSRPSENSIRFTSQLHLRIISLNLNSPSFGWTC
jgi:hypothetical protein